MDETVYVYIMEPQDGRFYAGHTNEPVRREQEHQCGHISNLP